MLAKLAKFTGPTKENVLAGAKSSGNFVFTAVSPPKKEIQSGGDQDSKVNIFLRVFKILVVTYIL